MIDPADFSQLFGFCDDIDALLALLGKTSNTMTDADKLRLLRVIMAFLGLCLKVDLKLTV